MIHHPAPELFTTKIGKFSGEVAVVVEMVEVETYGFCSPTGLTLMSIAPECIRF